MCGTQESIGVARATPAHATTRRLLNCQVLRGGVRVCGHGHVGTAMYGHVDTHTHAYVHVSVLLGSSLPRLEARTCACAYDLRVSMNLRQMILVEEQISINLSINHRACHIYLG